MHRRHKQIQLLHQLLHQTAATNCVSNCSQLKVSPYAHPTFLLIKQYVRWTGGCNHHCCLIRTPWVTPHNCAPKHVLSHSKPTHLWPKRKNSHTASEIWNVWLKSFSKCAEKIRREIQQWESTAVKHNGGLWLHLSQWCWKSCQNRWTYEDRTLPSDLEPSCNSIWLATFFGTTVIPNTMPVQQKTYLNRKTCLGLPRAQTLTLLK